MAAIKKTVGLLILLSVTSNAFSENLAVLGDFGGEPIALILADVLPKDEPTEVPKIDVERELKKQFNFPFQPNSATSGGFVPRDFKTPLSSMTSPVALVGTDNRSERWLRAYSSKLNELGATVLVVQANDVKSLKQTMSIYKGKKFPLANSDKIFSHFGIDKYPVLITKDGVYQ